MSSSTVATNPYTNPNTGAATVTIPSTYGASNNPLSVFTNMIGAPGGSLNQDILQNLTNPLAYLEGKLSSGPSSLSTLPNPNTGQLNSLISGLGLSLNPTLPQAPQWVSTPNLQQMAALQGTPLDLNSVINANGGLQNSVINPVDQGLASFLQTVMPQYAQAAFQSSIAGAGAASGVPGETAVQPTGTGGSTAATGAASTGALGRGGPSVFNASTLTNLLQNVVGPEYNNLLNDYMGGMQTLQAADVGNAGWMSQQANQFTNNMDYEAYARASQEALNQQNIAAGLAGQQLGAQDQAALNYQNALLNAWQGSNNQLNNLTGSLISDAFTPEQTINTGAQPGVGSSANINPSGSPQSVSSGGYNTSGNGTLFGGSTGGGGGTYNTGYGNGAVNNNPMNLILGGSDGLGPIGKGNVPANSVNNAITGVPSGNWTSGSVSGAGGGWLSGGSSSYSPPQP